MSEAAASIADREAAAGLQLLSPQIPSYIGAMKSQPINGQESEILAACKAALAWFEREAEMCQRAGGDNPDGEPLDAYSTDCGDGENNMDVAALRNAIRNAT